MLTLRSRKKSATGFQKQTKFKLPEGKGKRRRQILRVFRKFKYVILFSIPLILLISVFIIEKVFSPFSITNINVKNFSLTDTDKSLIIGKNLYFINERIINDLVLSNHIEVKNFKIEKKYPDTLDITATKRLGVFRIKNNKQYLIVDEDGVVFTSVASSKLTDFPIKVDKIAVGTVFNKQDLILYTDIVNSLLDLKLNVDFVYLQGEFIYIEVKDKYKIKFNKLTYLQEIQMFRNAAIQIDSGEKVKEISFVDNKVLIQY